MTTTNHTTTDAVVALAEAQNRLTRALIIEPRDVNQIVELAENVRRLEAAALKAERVSR